MKYLFNNASFPIHNEPIIEAIVRDLKDPEVRAVAYRPAFMQETLKYLRRAIRAPQSDVSQKYKVQEGAADREMFAGRVTYFTPFATDDIHRESTTAGIIIDTHALQTLTDTVNHMRGIFTEVYRSFANDRDNQIAGDALFTPKGGIGRAPMIHVDFLPLTGHFAVALAPLDIMLSEPDDRMWDALNRRKRNLLSPAEQALNDHWLTEMAIDKQDDFSYSQIGDLLFVKGQRFVDLDDPHVRRQMCVHKSSALIETMGQASALFYPKFAKPTPT